MKRLKIFWDKLRVEYLDLIAGMCVLTTVIVCLILPWTLCSIFIPNEVFINGTPDIMLFFGKMVLGLIFYVLFVGTIFCVFMISKIFLKEIIELFCFIKKYEYKKKLKSVFDSLKNIIKEFVNDYKKIKRFWIESGKEIKKRRIK